MKSVFRCSQEADGRVNPTLVWKDQGRISGNHGCPREHKLGVEDIASRFVDFFSGEVTG